MALTAVTNNAATPAVAVLKVQPPATTPATTPAAAATVSRAPSTPAATVSLSAQAGAPPANTAAATYTKNPASQASNAKLAIKEGNEPLVLLTRQAKHGDLVAKLLLKQLNKKAELKKSQQKSSGSGGDDTSAGSQSKPETPAGSLVDKHG